MFVYDLRGPQFLCFYLSLLCLAVLATFSIRKRLRSPNDDGGPEALDIDPYEVAALVSEARAADTVIAHLAERGHIWFDGGTKRVVRVDTEAGPRHPFERSVHDIPSSCPLPLAVLRELAAGQASGLSERLFRRGMLCGPRERTLASGSALGVLGFVFLVGVPKVFVGLARGRPVLGLLLLLGMTSLIALILAMHPPRRTLRGERVLQRLANEHVSLRTTAQAGGAGLNGRELVMALGLFGLGAVQALEHLDLRDALRGFETSQSDGGSGGASGCGGGGCGGGGCGAGCGGCGG